MGAFTVRFVLQRERLRCRLHRRLLRLRRAGRPICKADYVNAGRNGWRWDWIWILVADCLRGELIPQPQNPTDYVFDLHAADYVVPLETPAWRSGYTSPSNLSKSCNRGEKALSLS